MVSFLDPRLPERFWSKCIPEPNSGCWIWIGAAIPPQMYGRIGKEGASESVKIATHRLAYETLIGPIPQGLELDHLCKTPPCCNPMHLEPVTHRENMLRGDTIFADQVRRTHCPSGHLLDGVRANGCRYCKECNRIRNRAARRSQ